MKIIWISDIHLNFLGLEIRLEFYKKLKGDLVIVSGDIAEGRNIVKLIQEMEDYIGIPVYFVLGNHDFYGSSIKAVKQSVTKCNWLGNIPLVHLNESTALIGVDGWGDCRNGDFENSRIVMNDWIYIEEIQDAYGTKADDQKLKRILQKLADADASLLRRRVRSAIKKGYKNLILVSHVPPFAEACLHAGRKSTPSGLPFFSSKVLGDRLLDVAKENPEVSFLWLSGHTHSKAEYKPCENMIVKVADAQYYLPNIAEEIEI